MTDPLNLVRSTLREPAPGVYYVPTLMANVYMIGTRRGGWVLIDAGLPGTAPWIERAAEEVFGHGSRPDAIILTHGHFDHVGALEDLLDIWQVPVYAHKLEIPYLTGRSDYPPPDPTVGGFMANVSRTFSNRGIDLGFRISELTGLNRISAALESWTVIETPGHSPGHISLFRESGRTLVAGDAVITVNQENAAELLAQKQQLRRPPIYFTCDWSASESSVRKLADLKPNVIASGHGLPMSGPGIAEALERLANNFRPPRNGRYVERPARTDEHGVAYLPPPIPAPLPKIAAGIALGALVGFGVVAAAVKRRD